MKLVNLGCGGVRLPNPWINIDTLKGQFAPNTVERMQIDRVPNYIEHDLRSGIPFDDGTVDGVLASHFLEHLDAQAAWKLVAEARRVLIPGGVFCASVPDTNYFRKVHAEDTHANSGRLFGEQLDNLNPNTSFFDAALFFNEHLQLLTEDSLWALLRKGGFDQDKIHNGKDWNPDNEVYRVLASVLNRPVFSLVLWGIKGGN